MTMKTYLALALLVTVLAGNAYGEGEVYYCAETDKNGFWFDEALKKYKPSLFTEKKFKIKFDSTAKTVEIKGYPDDISKNGTYNCRASLRKTYPQQLSCHAKFSSLNFNSNTGRFVLFSGYAYFNVDGDSISSSYGTCEKF